MKNLMGVMLLVGATVFAGYYRQAPNPDRTTYICSARNILGHRFSATGTDQALVQEEAMKMCETKAWRCYPTGCKASKEKR